MVILWIAFGCMIYIRDLPGGNGFVIATASVLVRTGTMNNEKVSPIIGAPKALQ